MKKTVCSLIRPAECAFDPSQPGTVANMVSCFGEMPTDLNSVFSQALAEPADLSGVLGQNRICGNCCIDPEAFTDHVPWHFVLLVSWQWTGNGKNPAPDSLGVPGLFILQPQ